MLRIAICVISLFVAIVLTHLQTMNWPSQYRYESMLGSVFITLAIAPAAAYFGLGLLISNQGLLIELEQLASQDELTGLLNRRAFLRNSQTLLLAETKPAVLLGDVDWFKKINDTFGHAGGDEALRHISAILRQHSSHADLVARFGGEEFVIFFKWDTLKQAQQKAEMLRKAVENSPCVFEGATIPMTISFGLAIGDERDTSDSLLKRADAALYRAKANGRNQTLLAA